VVQALTVALADGLRQTYLALLGLALLGLLQVAVFARSVRLTPLPAPEA
jgi:hypothetical protein